MRWDRPQGGTELLVSGTIPDRPVSINQWHIPLDDGEGDIWVTFITVVIEPLHTGTIRQLLWWERTVKVSCVFYDVTHKHGTVHTRARERWFRNKYVYMFKAQTEKMEAVLTAIATAWTLHHSYCSLEHSVTLGACVECQLPPRKLESLSQPFLNVTNLPGPLIHMPSLQLFLIPVQIINP